MYYRFFSGVLRILKRACDLLFDKIVSLKSCFVVSQMDNVLIDDRRIHVDFSQSVSHLWNRYRKFGTKNGDGEGQF